MAQDILFTPLKFRKLQIKNRIIRSSVSGRFDHYDGHGTQVRINWELKFAKGGAGAIISSFAPVSIEGRIIPNVATIHHDDRIPFWRELVKQVHQHDCKYIIQLSHSGRQRDIGGIENVENKAMSSTNHIEAVHGLRCQSMNREQIQMVVNQFAESARRAEEAKADGVELHACHGYLITQFLSSAINDRTDEYGGSLENRARFLLEIVKAIRKKVGRDFHLQVKINGTDYNNAVFFWHQSGNKIDETIQICKWLEAEGVDAIHVSTGSFFPHPFSPAGDFPLEELSHTYGSMLSWGKDTFRNYLLFRYKPLRPFFRLLWHRLQMKRIEGINALDSQKVKRAVKIPVVCTGGFQNASYIRHVIRRGMCDGVTITRSLIANPDLVKIFESGEDKPKRPCTYCNKCLVNILENPMGCYDLSRYGGNYEKMLGEVMSVFQHTEFAK